MLSVTEIFTSIQGESTFAGLPCVFVRLAGCNLRCTYCDSTYAYAPGAPRTVESVVEEVAALAVTLVEITGGEPLLQAETPELCRRLLDRGRRVLVETNGTLDIGALPPGVVRIMDVKCPGSGEAGRLLPGNLAALRPEDECKLVLCDRADFDWAAAFVREHDLARCCTVIFSPVWATLPPADLAEWILSSGLTVRLGLQLHKVVWGGDTRR
jgi:7-carboxy-7-deazaguanine synthase